MELVRISKAKAIEYLANAKNGTEPVWFKTNGNTPTNANVDRIYIDNANANGWKSCHTGRWVNVYKPVDAGKVYFRYDSNGNKVGIYGYDECKIAYVPKSDYAKLLGKGVK